MGSPTKQRYLLACSISLSCFLLLYPSPEGQAPGDPGVLRGPFAPVSWRNRAPPTKRPSVPALISERPAGVAAAHASVAAGPKPNGGEGKEGTEPRGRGRRMRVCLSVRASVGVWEQLTPGTFTAETFALQVCRSRRRFGWSWRPRTATEMMGRTGSKEGEVGSERCRASSVCFVL